MKINSDCNIVMRHKNVNWRMIVDEYTQKIKRYVHWFSYTPRCIMKSVFLGSISRIVKHSSDNTHIKQSIVKLIMELRLLCYPLKFIYRIMKKKSDT